MIKLFRKIRQKLLVENRFNKYLLYAIGEIVLVVIGILIALQINNWNDHRKETLEMHQYLAKIRDNVALDITVLDSIKLRRTNMQIICAEATKKIMQNQFDINTFMESVQAFVEYYFVPNQSGFEALKNSSYLGKINGTKLDRLLDDYYSTINQIIKEEEGFNALIENMEYRFVGNNDLTQMMVLYFQGIETLKQDPVKFEAIENRMHSLYNDNAYRAIITRTASQTAMLRMYDDVIKQGRQVILEINNMVND